MRKNNAFFGSCRATKCLNWRLWGNAIEMYSPLHIIYANSRLWWNSLKFALLPKMQLLPSWPVFGNNCIFVIFVCFVQLKWGKLFLKTIKLFYSFQNTQPFNHGKLQNMPHEFQCYIIGKYHPYHLTCLWARVMGLITKASYNLIM